MFYHCYFDKRIIEYRFLSGSMIPSMFDRNRIFLINIILSWSQRSFNPSIKNFQSKDHWPRQQRIETFDRGKFIDFEFSIRSKKTRSIIRRKKRKRRKQFSKSNKRKERRNASNAARRNVLYTRKHTYTSLFAIAGMVCEHRWLLRSIDRAQQLVPWPDLVWTLHSSLCLALTQSPSPPLHPPCVSLFVSLSLSPPLLRPPIIYPPVPRTAVVSSTLHSHHLHQTLSLPPPPPYKNLSPSLLLFLCLSPLPPPLSTQY